MFNKIKSFFVSRKIESLINNLFDMSGDVADIYVKAFTLTGQIFRKPETKKIMADNITKLINTPEGEALVKQGIEFFNTLKTNAPALLSILNTTANELKAIVEPMIEQAKQEVKPLVDNIDANGDKLEQVFKDFNNHNG